MDQNNVLRLALSAGEIMLANGAETYRVEDTMRRILACGNFESSEAFVAATGLFASFEAKDKTIATALRHVKSRQTEFEKIIRVNEISRKFTAGEIDCETALKMLDDTKYVQSFPSWLKISATGVSAASFCYLLGGGVTDSLCALTVGLILQCLLVFAINRAHMPGVLHNVVSGGIISLMSLVLVTAGFGQNIDKVIIGALMPMLPGLTITNAIRDVVEGDYISGTARMTDAVLTAIALATGVGTLLSIWEHLFAMRLF